MQVIRLSRAGKKGQPHFRIVVAEKSAAVKGKFQEIVGYYSPVSKQVELKKDRIEYWISQGAIPSDSAAVLFKSNGLANMEKYIDSRDKKRKKKKEEETKPEAKPVENPAGEDSPKEEAKEETPATEEVKEETKEEAPAEEPKEEKAAAEEVKEEAPAEGAPKEEEKKEE